MDEELENPSQLNNYDLVNFLLEAASDLDEDEEADEEFNGAVYELIMRLQIGQLCQGELVAIDTDCGEFSEIGDGHLRSAADRLETIKHSVHDVLDVCKQLNDREMLLDDLDELSILNIDIEGNIIPNDEETDDPE